MTAVFLSLAACNSQDTEDWQLAKDLDTDWGYAHFLDSHPGSSYTAEAANRLRLKLLVACRQQRVIESCRAFVGRFPGDPETIILRTKEIPDMLYAQAAESRSLPDYGEYLKNSDSSHPKYQSVVKLVKEMKRRDEAAWLEAKRDSSIESFGRYLGQNPGGAHRAEASSRIDSLKRPLAAARPLSREESSTSEDLVKLCNKIKNYGPGVAGPGGPLYGRESEMLDILKKCVELKQQGRLDP